MNGSGFGLEFCAMSALESCFSPRETIIASHRARVAEVEAPLRLARSSISLLRSPLSKSLAWPSHGSSRQEHSHPSSEIRIGRSWSGHPSFFWRPSILVSKLVLLHIAGSAEQIADQVSYARLASRCEASVDDVGALVGGKIVFSVSPRSVAGSRWR